MTTAPTYTAICLPPSDAAGVIRAAKAHGYAGNGGGWIYPPADGCDGPGARDAICQSWAAFAVLYTLAGGCLAPRLGVRRLGDGYAATDAAGHVIGTGSTPAAARHAAVAALMNADVTVESATRTGSSVVVVGRKMVRDDRGVYRAHACRLAFDKADVDADIFVHTHRQAIREAVGNCNDVAVLKQIAALVGYDAGSKEAT
jgi:hypothetical protein